jgi:hypothetical protein
MKKVIATVGLTLLLLSVLPAFPANNYGLWTSAGIRKDFHQWKLELNEEFRFRDQAPTLGRYITELSAGYDVADWLSLGAGYRLTRDRDKDSNWRTLHRFVVDARMSRDIGRIRISYRLRYTNEDDFIAGGHDSNYFLRQKAEAEYHIRDSRWEPFFSGELYYQLPDDNAGAFNKIRYTLGTKVALDHRNRFGLFLRLQHELNVSRPDRDFVTGLSYTYRL